MNDQNPDSSGSDDPFAERSRKREGMYVSASIVDVIGVFISGGGGHTDPDGQFNMTLKFDAWKMPPGKLYKNELSIDFKSSREKCDALRDLLDPYNIYRIRAQVVLASDDFDWDEARLVELIGVDTSDLELNECLIELQKTVTYDDPRLGIFTLNRDYTVFSSKVEWDKQEVELNLNANDLEESDGALKTAHQLWNHQHDWNQRVRQYLVHELLPVKNESWRDDDEAEINATDFNAKTELESILVNDDGSFEFWFDDGEMFGYHRLYCRGDLARGFFEASLG